MRTILVLVLLAGAGSAGSARTPAPLDLEQQLIALERQSWVAWQQHDSRFWQTFLSDDHVEVHMGIGVTGKQQVRGRGPIFVEGPQQGMARLVAPRAPGGNRSPARGFVARDCWL